VTETAERWEATMMPNYGTPDLELVEGDGCWVHDADGQPYLDLLGGLAVAAVGHAHPRVVHAVQAQAAEVAHVSNLYATPPALELAERLSERTYGYKVAQLNSGSEAIELAYKVARRHAHQQGEPEARVLAFENGFHGRTTAALGLTGQPGKQAGFGPFPDPIEHVPYDDPEALEATFEDGPVGAVVVEYVQGEGGVVPLSDETAGTLHDLASDHGALVVADEVQTGLGRTGRFYAHQHHDVQPDVVTVAKALGGGLPAAACLVRPDLADLMGPGSHGCTFGGNPIASAAGNAVLDTYEVQGLGERARELGQALSAELDETGLPHRGRGLLLGIEVPEGTAGAIREQLQEKGVLVGTAGSDVVRLAPPLTIDEADLLDAVGPIGEAVHEATSQASATIPPDG
jgi:acetylornithine aminotransferase